LASQKSVIIENAQQFAAKGKIDKAIAEWKKLIAETPQDGNIYNNISDLYLRNNDKASAIDAALKAAGVYREAGFELKGIAVLKKILKIDPNRIDVYEMLADINADRGLTGNAVDGYQQTAKLYMKNGNFKGAISVYNKLNRFAPEDSEIPIAVARLYQKQERYREAILSYEQAMAILESKKMVSEARQIVEEIMKIDPSYLKQLAAKEANVASIVDMGIERDITLAPSKQTEALGKFEKEDLIGESFFGEEIEIFRDLIPDNTPSHPKGMDLEGNSVPAVSSFQKPVVDVLPVPPPLAKKPVFEEKIEEPQKVSDVVLDAHLSEADAYLRYGLNQNAIEKLLLVKELAPMREETYIRLKEVYLKEGQNHKAAMAGANLADIYEKRGELVKQESLLAELREIDPTGAYKQVIEDVKIGSRSEGAATTVPHIELSALLTPVVKGAKRPSEQSEREGEAPSALPMEGATRAPVKAVPSLLDNVHDDSFLQAIRETDFEGFSDLSHPSSAQGIPPLDINLRTPVAKGERPLREEEIQEESFDLAAAITQELDNLSVNSLALTQEGPEPIPSESLEGVLNEKKQQYLETCYHLGIAQKEMGNFTKAIREFEQALDGEGRFQEVLSMLAGCYAEQGDLAHAAAVLQKGVNDPRSQGGARFAILYDLASIHEQLGEKEKSFALYKEIYRVDPKFRDVSGKVKEIPYRKPGADTIRLQEAARFASEGAGVKDKPLATVVKEKRRISYV
jgi:tetratricopeptide (TPR) repeat protein